MKSIDVTRNPVVHSRGHNVALGRRRERGPDFTCPRGPERRLQSQNDEKHESECERSRERDVGRDSEDDLYQ